MLAAPQCSRVCPGCSPHSATSTSKRLARWDGSNTDLQYRQEAMTPITPSQSLPSLCTHHAYAFGEAHAVLRFLRRRLQKPCHAALRFCAVRFCVHDSQLVNSMPQEVWLMCAGFLSESATVNSKLESGSHLQNRLRTAGSTPCRQLTSQQHPEPWLVDYFLSCVSLYIQIQISMYTYMYMYIYLYLYIYRHIHAYVYTHMYVNIRKYVYAYVNLKVNVYIYIYVYVYMHI